MTNNLIESHLGYAHAMVADFAGKYPPNVTRGDLNGAAELGLVQAAHSFDPARGVSFTTFAYFRIRGAIFDEIRKLWQSSCLSVSEQGGRESEQNDDASPMQDGNQADTPDHSASHARAHSSYSGDPETLPDPGESPAGHVLRQEQCECIRKALHQLPPRHRFVLQAYYYDGVSMVHIGRQLNLSKSWVSRIHAQALSMVRGNMESTPAVHSRRSVKKPSLPQRHSTPRRNLSYATNDHSQVGLARAT